VSEFLQQYRAKYPEYSDLDDNQLTTTLHGKYNADTGAQVTLPEFYLAIGYQPAPIEPEPSALQQPISQQDQPIDGYTGAAMKVVPEKPMLELIGEKLKNWGAGAGERLGDVSGALLKTIETTGRGLEEKFPMGGLVWEEGDILPSVLGPKEWAERDAKPILLEGAKVLEGIDLGYQQQVGWEDVKQSFSEGGALSGSAYADVLEYGLEQGIKSVPDMVAAIYALPTYVFARSGEIGEQRAKNKGKEQADLEDVLEAAPFAAASALLERIGAKGMTSGAKEALGKEMIKAGLKESAKRSAKAGGKALSREAATEAIQEGMLEYVGERYGTDAKMDFMEALDRAAAGAVAGGVFGGAVGTTTAVANEISYSPTKEFAKALDAEIDATTIEGAEQAARDALKPERAQLVAEPQVKQEADIKTVPEAKAEAAPLPQWTADQPIPGQMPQQEPVAIDIPQEITDAGVDTAGVQPERADIERGAADQRDIAPATEPEQRVDKPAVKPESSRREAEPMADAAVQPAPALTPMPKRVVVGPASYEPKPVGGDLYRQTGIESLSDLLLNALSNNVEKGSVTPVFVADNSDMALGQGKNKKGIMVEFDGSLVSGEPVKKPGIIEGVTGKEYKTDFVGRDAIKTFTVPKGVRIGGAARVMASRHFDVSKNPDGSRTYTRKDLVQQPQEAVTDKPMAAEGFDSYRYKGRYGWVMIGAKSEQEALSEAGRTVTGDVSPENLQKWDGVKYTPIKQAESKPDQDVKPETAKGKAKKQPVSQAPIKETEVEADAAPEYSSDALGAFNSFAKTLVDQTATAEDIKADAERVIANKDQIIEQLSQRKVTKAMLQSVVRSPRTDLKKPQLVKQAYQSMLSAHALGDGVVTIFGGSKSFEEQVIDQINNQTQEDIDNAYEKQRQYRAERERQKESFVKALTKPESLAEFKQFIKVKGKDKLTAEQLKAYDELVADSLRPEDKPKIVEVSADQIKTERAKTTHTKTGADLYVVKLAERVERDKFKELSTKAKQLGGYYSSYSKGDAIPGFQFKTDDAANQFEALLSGKDIDTSNLNEAKVEQRQAKNADKLADMADKLEAKAEEELTRDRQTNTGRRASMAANAMEQAYKKQAFAKTLRNIATRLQQGELHYLGKITQATQLEELMSAQKRAIPTDMYRSEYDGYSMNYDLKEGVTIDDYIASAKMPIRKITRGQAAKIGQALKGVRGYARLAAEMRKDGVGRSDLDMRVDAENAKKLLKASKEGLIDGYQLGFLPDQDKAIGRLERLGIATDEQLRAAIRELDSLSVEKQKEDPLNKLERDLVGKKIEGYFPTPKTLVEQMLDYADILPGHRVLEPSAGKGNIADEITQAAPDAELDVIEYNSGLSAILTAKGYIVVGNDFLEHKGEYDRIVMNPPFENFQDIDHVRHAYELLRPGGKLVAIMGAGVKNSRKKAVEFREWVDDMGSYIEDLPAGSFKSSERPTGVATVMVTIEKNDNQTLNYKSQDSKEAKPAKAGERIYNAPGHNFIGLFKSTGIPERREFVIIEGRKLKIPEKPQRIEPIMRKLTQIMGQRIYFGKIKGKSQEGFYRPNVGEIRTRRKNDVEVLAHEMAHYLDIYSNVTLPNFQKLYKDKRYVDEVMALSYTDATPDLQRIEGFAEFVRLWLTNAQEAQRRAPKFYDAFTDTLARDRKLLNPMRDMQDLMHKFFFQGPDKLGQALIGKDQSFIQTFDEWKYRRDSRIRQQTIDRFHAARKIEQELTRKISGANESAWKQFRIANGGAEGIADYVMNYGTVNFDESGDLKRTGDSLHDVLQPVKTIELKPEHKGEEKIDLLMRYFAGRRALELHRQKRENLIPKETAKEWARLGSTYPVFESIHKDYQAFNQRLMDFYVASGMITADGRKAMESMNKDYVPFNRIRETLTDGKSAGSAGLQKLKGGTANLNDILVNIQDGIATNIRSALNNRAKQRLYQYISGHKDGAIFATRIAPDSRKVKVYQDEMVQKIGKVLEASGIEVEGEIDLSDPSLMDFWQHGVKPQLNESGNIVDTVIIDGKRKYYEVQDPLLQEMLLGMNPESYSTFMNVMFGVKNFFTRMITLGIEFTGANLVRDTVGATFISKNNFRPFVDSFKGMYSFIAQDQHFQDFMRSGGGYSSRLHASTKEGVARRKVAVDEFGVMTGPERILSAIDNIASAFEYGTRIGEFRLAKKNKRSDLDAAFAAREISTDFSVLGANHFLTGYIRTVPFLNAMVQSQDRVFREAIIKKQYDGNPAGLAMKAFLGLTIPTLILYLVNKDDDDYKQIPDYEKRTNWHIKVGDGQFVKIPRPYDVGFVYATMPELFFKYVEDENGKELADGMLWTLTQMYGIDGTPAMMTGWWDLVRNEKWTGASVVPQSLANVEATEQYTSNTSETFIRLGEATGMSPVKAEHMFKAYTGYLGGYLMWGTDHLLWDESKFGDKPDRKASDNVFLRRFLTPEVRPSGAAMEKFFDLKEKSDKIVATFKQTIDVRRAIKKRELGSGFKDDKFFGLSGKEKGVLFALNDSMNQLIKLMYGKEGIKTAELKIKHDPRLTGAEKRKKLDQLWLRRNKAFMQYYSQADKALQKAKAESINQEK
tara:strand:+ start:6077 stop:13843 length:7767 start_codon:yes stop_codon:yes gene_type:complete